MAKKKADQLAGILRTSVQLPEVRVCGGVVDEEDCGGNVRDKTVCYVTDGVWGCRTGVLR